MSNLKHVEEFYRQAVPVGSKILVHSIDEEFLQSSLSVEYGKHYKAMEGTIVTVIGHQDADLKIERFKDDGGPFYLNFLSDKLEIVKTDKHKNV